MKIKLKWVFEEHNGSVHCPEYVSRCVTISTVLLMGYGFNQITPQDKTLLCDHGDTHINTYSHSNYVMISFVVTTYSFTVNLSLFTVVLTLTTSVN
jgi:hypothetical protein